jgi:hypothetical protein
MSLAVSITGQKAVGQGVWEVMFNLTTSGTYTNLANGGDIINFATATQDPAFQGAEFQVQNSGSGPISLQINSTTGKLITYSAVLGTTLANSKFVLAATFNTEATNASAYPEAVMSGVALFKAWL